VKNVRESLGRLLRRTGARRDVTAEPAADLETTRRKGPARSALSASRPAALAERIERAPSLDRPVHALSQTVVRALPPGPQTDALHGVPFGQPAHPALVRMPLGCWTSAVLLDFFHGTERASGTLVAVGLAGALPSAATGLADWSALHRHQQRVGLVHAMSQAGATTLFGASLLARATGRHGNGKLLSATGLAVATVGAYLGGHLALRLGAGASHAEPIEHLAALGWHDLCPLGELPDGRLTRRQLGYLSLLALRQDDAVHVLSDHCAHLGGPLHQGRVVTVRDATCVTCPWHGSTFRVSDGAVIHGPATARQPAFESRITESGWVQVRPRARRGR
jgi:nitrite reductase/ring-hydroxylating ferredoxin subunit